MIRFITVLKTGGATSYLRLVGSALASARRVLIAWSQNALRSDFVRAEVIIATGGDNKIGVFLMPDAPPFPISGVERVQDYNALSEMLESWKVTVQAVRLGNSVAGRR